ncbi:hypothetical protein BS17DRAFT_686284, partial [Gyrodon lividus]
KPALIVFHYIPGSHTGIAIARALLHLIDRAGIRLDRVYIVRTIHSSSLRHSNSRQTLISGNEQGWLANDKGNTIKLPVVQLLCNVKTRWDSTYYMINRLRALRQVPSNAQQSMCGESVLLLGGALPSYETFLAQWTSLSLACNHPQLTSLISPGLESANHYHDRLGHSKAYLFAMFVDPCIQLSWVEQHWELEAIVTAKTDIRQKVKYHKKYSTQTVASPLPTHSGQPHAFMTLGEKYGLASMRIRAEEQVVQSIDQEYNAYSTSNLAY